MILNKSCKIVLKSLIILLFLVITICVTGCSNSNKLSEIAKNINNCESVKNYKEYGYDIKASTTKDTLIITSKMDDKNSKVEFKLNGNILSNENLSTDDLMTTLLVINGIGQTYGYKDGELSQNINTFSDEYKNYTLDNEGLELVMNDDNVSLKIDLSKKVPLIDMNKFYLKTDDLDMISELVKDKETGNQNGKTGNIAYDIFIGDEKSTIQIGQYEKLSDSAYKSILTALELMYGKDTAKHFQELYPNFVDGKKTAQAFTIEKDYKPEDQDNSVFKDTEVVLVTINNKIVKK